MNAKVLTAEQKVVLENSKRDLVAKVMATKDTPKGYPRKTDGSLDFNASPVEQPISEQDVTYLVGLYYAIRLNEGIGHDEAARQTYACCYKTGGRFSPHQTIAELKQKYGDK